MIAVVLMVGLTAVSATGLVLVADGAISETKQTTETRSVEMAFQELDSEVDAVASSDDRTRTVEFDLPEDADGAIRKEATGRLHVTVDNGTGTRTIVDRSMGAVVYDDDEWSYAYQMGAIWQGSGQGTTMVSAPDVVYRNGTLTFPVVDLGGDRRFDGDEATARKNETVAPLTNVTALEDTLVTIRIRSDYYAGWAEYFRQRVHPDAVSVDHATRTVVVQLGHPDIDGEFYPGLVANGDVFVYNGNPTMHTGIRTSGSVYLGPASSVTCSAGSGPACVTWGTVDRPELDWGIRKKVSLANGSAPAAGIDGCSGTKTLTAGTYYSDGFNLSGCTLELDLSGGNVTLVVDGNVGVTDRIDVVNGNVNATCCYARVYTTGDVAMAKGTSGVTVDTGNATRFQLYGTSETHFGIGQSPNGFTGVVYAPRQDPATGSNQAVAQYGLTSATAACTAGVNSEDVCIGQGNAPFEGGIVSGSIEIEQHSSFEYATELQHVEPTLDMDVDVYPPDLTYVHLSVHEVDVEN